MRNIGSNCRSPNAKAKALPKAKSKAGNKGWPRKTTKGKGGGKVIRESSTRLVKQRKAKNRNRSGPKKNRRKKNGRRSLVRFQVCWVS